MNEHEVWTGEPAPVRGAYWVRVDDGHVTIATFNAGEKLICIRERSVAPIPPAEEIAAMREVVEALREAATSLGTISRLAGRDEDMMDIDEVRGYAASRAMVAREALSRLDAARKGGAT